MTAMTELFPGWMEIITRARNLPQGGMVTVKTYACNEIQVQLQSGIASLLRRDIHKVSARSAERGASSLVLCRKSQTFPETGEVVELPRERKFSSAGRHMLRECGAVMEERYGKNIKFLTLTLPGSTPEAVREFATYDKQIKNAFLQMLRKCHRRYVGDGLGELDYCMVSELQGRGAIHFHIAVGCSNAGFSKALSTLYRRWWSKLIRWYSRISGTNLAMSVEHGDLQFRVGHWFLECATVEKSVANYLAKYISKAKTKTGMENVDCPSRWWQVSKSMRDGALSARHAESVRVWSWEEARRIVERAARVLDSNGIDFKVMWNSFNGEPLGLVLFPKKELQWWYYEWLRLLLHSKTDVIPNEEDCLWLTKKNEAFKRNSMQSPATA